MANTTAIQIYNLSSTTNSITVKYKLEDLRQVYRAAVNVAWTKIEILYSTNGGTTWSSPITITNFKSPGNNTYKITGLTVDTEYFILIKGYNQMTKDPLTDMDSKWTTVNKSNPILRIGNATYSSEHTTDNWTDFTDCLVAPNYKVNNLGVSEEWEDANWVKHYVTPRKRIQGSFELLFTDKNKYWDFIKLIQDNEDYEETYTLVDGTTITERRGPGIVKMKLQVNNELDTASANSVHKMMPMIYKGLFKITWEPIWFVPFIGFKEYDAITVEIEEA